ncbi:DUF3558 family protein [Actinokineospora sp. NPDC004072]
MEPPEVETGIDVLPWTYRPCDVLTDAQARYVGVEAPAEASVPDEQGAECSRTAGDGPDLRIRLYGRREEVTGLLLATDVRTQYLAEATVEGQPAIVASPESTPQRRCVVGVMMAEEQSIEIKLEAEDRAVCDRALVVAGFVVATMG